MNRKPWMPETLTGWVSFLTKTLALLSVISVGLYHVGSGLSGLKGLPADVGALTVEVGSLGKKIDRLIVHDSIEAVQTRVYRTQTNCILDKVVREQPITRYDCTPATTNGGES